LQCYFEATRQILLNHGIPGIYADRHSIFRSPKADKISIEEQLAGKVVNDTQFGRAMKELGITLIPARPTQAKRRVERLWDTLQSRFPIKFKVAGITNRKNIASKVSNNFVKTHEQFNNVTILGRGKVIPMFKCLKDMQHGSLKL
jgi:hypothetical protein